MVKLENGLYVGCGLTYAPKHFKREVEDLNDNLRADYKILDFVGDKPATNAEVYRWDINCVERCDAMLAIVDYPSLGLGWEMAAADHWKKPTLLVARVGREVSRLVLGAADDLPTFGFASYEYLRDVPEELDQFLGQRLLSHSVDESS